MKRPQITAVNHYDVFPFNHGGTHAVRGLENGLSKWFDVNLITFVSPDKYPDTIKLSDHLTIIPIPLPQCVIDKQIEFYDKYGMNKDTIYDSSSIVMRYYHEFPEILDRVREIGDDSVAVIAEHVYTWRILKKVFSDKPIIYRSHNVEFDYKTVTYKAIGSPQDLLDETFQYEKECCEECAAVLTVSQIEADRFMELYSFPEKMRGKFTDIHLGCYANAGSFVLPSKRKKPDKKYEFYGFFISSDMPSAYGAGRLCLEIARRNPNIKIYIVGRVGRLLKNEPEIPENVDITGLVSDEEKEYYLSHCDFAMNPVDSGAGVNVKMFEYYAYGIPVISTPHGARGTGLTNGVEGIIADSEHFVGAVESFCTLPMETKDRFAKNAYSLLEREFTWKSIAKKTAAIIGEICNLDYQESEVSDKETELYTFSLAESYIPQKEFYIRCAGNNGRKCLEFLRSKGLEPVAFIENDDSKVGTSIDGVRVVSLDDYILGGNNAEVVVAVCSWMKITAELITKGVPEERIAVAWRPDGQSIFHLSKMIGCYPLYHDPDKLRRVVQRIANEIKGGK